jgi:hypothetical protein
VEERILMDREDKQEAQRLSAVVLNSLDRESGTHELARFRR